MPSVSGPWNAVYTFGTDDHIHAPQLRLLQNGRIGGYDCSNERWWHLNSKGLSFLDEAGTVTTQFAEPADDGVWRGRFLRGSSEHVLRPTSPIHRFAPLHKAQDADRRSCSPARPNLVILRAGPTSEHARWVADVDPDDRSFDLCVSSYGGAKFDGWAEGDLSIEQNGQGKFKSLWRLLHEASPLWAYKRIMLCDDDISLRLSDVERLFDRAERHDLYIAQASLSTDSNVLHEITRHSPGHILRFTNFVEPMAPVFRSWVLALVVPAFEHATIGYGLDHLWRFMMGEQAGKMAIVDEVQMIHLKPHATTYSMLDALAEIEVLQQQYRFVPKCDQVGALLATT